MYSEDIKDENLWLMKGDCLGRMKEIPDGSVDMILADPPYGTTACKWDSVIPFEPMWEQLKRIIKPNGAIVLFGSEPFSSALRMSNIKQYKYDWKWNKTIGGNPFNNKHKPASVFEDVIVFNARNTYYPIMEDADLSKVRPLSKGEKKTDLLGVFKDGFKSSKNYDKTKRYPKNEIKISSRNKECNSLNRVHPTQKPVALMEYLIKTYTNENETVLDFTMGSGTTGVACVNTSRNFIGIERDDKYFDISVKRIRGEL